MTNVIEYKPLLKYTELINTDSISRIAQACARYSRNAGT